MPGPFFTTNDSDINQLEGLYVKERTPPLTVSGANLNAVAVAGTAIRGPVGKAVLCASEQRFIDVFGGRDQGSGGTPTSNLWKFLLNKPFGSLYVVRVAAAAAAAATATIYGAQNATGTIQAVAKASILEDETFILNDGVAAALTFKFKLAGATPTAGTVKVDLTSAVTAQDVANAIISAINSQTVATCNVYAYAANGTGLINLVSRTFGTAGNQAITETVTNAGFTVSGFTGGAAGVALATVAASSPGAWGNNATFQVQAASDGAYNHFNMVVSYLGKTYTYKNLDLSAVAGVGQDNSLTVIGNDDAVFVTLTKTASGLPAAMGSAQALTGGAESSVADSDYTAAGKGLSVLAATQGVGACVVAEYSSAALKSAILTKAAASSDRVWLMSADSETVSAATAITEAASYRSDRVVYCFNHAYTLDPSTAAELITSPTSWMASILSQTDVDVHPGVEDNKKFTAGITRLYSEAFVRGDYIAFKAAGICAMERLDGVGFVSGVTTSLTPGLEEVTRRRMADYLQISLAGALKHGVKQKNTLSRRKANAAMVTSFLDDLKQSERIVDDFKVDTEKLNTVTQRAQGIEKLLVRVKIIAHMLELVLETEIGTTVNIRQAQ